VSNGLTLIDAPHRIAAWFFKYLHNRNEKNSKVKTEYVDDYEFDLGYCQSYCLVIFMNCVLFSTIVPFIPFFACLFFYIKYLVDKNNLMFVYSDKFESGGNIRQKVKWYLFFNLYVYLIVMVSFFGLKFNKFYGYAGIIIVIIWTIFFIYFKHKIEPNQNFKELRLRFENLMERTD